MAMATTPSSDIPNRQSVRTRILVCFAVKEEAACFRKRGGGGGARVLITGMGRANTIRALRTAFDQESPDLVLTCGFAGGLRSGLRRGSVIFETGDRNLESSLKQGGAVAARFACVDRVAVTATEKRMLRESGGADAVEMESTAVQEECRTRQIPCATVRVILDEAEEDLPLDFNALMNSEARICPGKLIWAILRSPAKIPALMRFQKQAAEASDRLGQVLEDVCSRTAGRVG